MSRQAGEEGSERRRVEIEKKEMQDKLNDMAADLEKSKQNLANSEAKVCISIDYLCRCLKMVKR